MKVCIYIHSSFERKHIFACFLPNDIFAIYIYEIIRLNFLKHNSTQPYHSRGPKIKDHYIYKLLMRIHPAATKSLRRIGLSRSEKQEQFHSSSRARARAFFPLSNAKNRSGRYSAFPTNARLYVRDQSSSSSSSERI